MMNHHRFHRNTNSEVSSAYTNTSHTKITYNIQFETICQLDVIFSIRFTSKWSSLRFYNNLSIGSRYSYCINCLISKETSFIQKTRLR